MTNLVLSAQAAGQGGSSMSFLIMMIAIFVIMWLLMIRPQQKQQKKIREFQNSLAEGSSVVTGGGIHGTVKKVNLENGTIDLEIARGVVITVEKTSVFQDSSSQAAGKA